MSVTEMIRIAILDDYQNVSLEMADWSPLAGRGDHRFQRPSVQSRCHRRAPPAVRRRVRHARAHAAATVSDGAVAAPEADRIHRSSKRGHRCGGSGRARHRGSAYGIRCTLHHRDDVGSHPRERASRRLGKCTLARGGWQLTVGESLHGKTLGVLGLGNIGSEVARIGLAFGMEIIAWSQNLTTERAEACGARLVSKEELFRSADILTIHLVLSSRTKGSVGAPELQAMKPSARLINTSRGPIVDEPALIDVLRGRSIAGAALDVFDIEPLPADHPFRSLDNVLATPHIGFVARELYRTFYRDTVENITRWLAQQP